MCKISITNSGHD